MQPPTHTRTVADLRSVLPLIKSTVNYPLLPLTVFCKAHEELHPSFLAFSFETTALSKYPRLAYPTVAGTITSWADVQSATRYRLPPVRANMPDTCDVSTLFGPICYSINEPSRTYNANTFISGQGVKHPLYGWGMLRVGVDNWTRLPERLDVPVLFANGLQAVPLSELKLAKPIRRPKLAAAKAAAIVDRRVKADLPVVTVRIPETPALHESFGPGFPFETGREPGTIWVRFGSTDRLVTINGFLECSRPLVGLFEHQIVREPRTYKQFVRQNRQIFVAKIVSNPEPAEAVRKLAENRSAVASKELVQALKSARHLERYAVLPWTLKPIVGPTPEIVRCPFRFAGREADLIFTKYYKGRGPQFLTAKDRAENTYRFTDVQARRNQALGGDPRFSDNTFEEMSLEFLDGAEGYSDVDSFSELYEDEITQIQSEWFGSLKDSGKALALVQEIQSALERKQLLMKYDRELRIARASLERGRYDLANRACKLAHADDCGCERPKCDCLRPRFKDDNACQCPEKRCVCWVIIQQCRCQFNDRRPFASCPQKWVRDPRGPELETRTISGTAKFSGYSIKQARTTLRDIEQMVNDNQRAWLKKEYGRPLPADNMDYYHALIGRAVSYYPVPASLTPIQANSGEEFAREVFHQWRAALIIPIELGDIDNSPIVM